MGMRIEDGGLMGVRDRVQNSFPPGGRSLQDALRRAQSGGFDPQNQFMLGTLGGSGYGPNPLGTAGPGGSVSQHNQRVQQMRQQAQQLPRLRQDMPPLAYDQDHMMRQPQQTQPMQLGRMQPMEQPSGGIFGGRGQGLPIGEASPGDSTKDWFSTSQPSEIGRRLFEREKNASLIRNSLMSNQNQPGDNVAYPSVGNFGPHSVQRRHGGFAPNIPNVPDGSSFPGGPPQITSPGGREVESLPGIEPPRQEIGDLLPGKPPRQSPWQPPGRGRGRMPQPNQGYGDRFGGLQFSGPFAQPMMPRNYGMGGGYGQRPMPMPQPQYPRFPMHGGGRGGMGGGYGQMPQRPPMYGGGFGGGFGGGMGGGMGGGYGGGMGGGYGMPQRPPMYGGGFGGGFGGMGGGYGQMPQRPPMYGGGMGGGFGGGFGGMGGGYGQMPQPPMYGGGRGGFGGGYGMPQRPPMYGGGMGGGMGGGRGGYGGGMGGGFEAYQRNFNDRMSRGNNLTRMQPDGSMVY